MPSKKVQTRDMRLSAFPAPLLIGGFSNVHLEGFEPGSEPITSPTEMQCEPALRRVGEILTALV